MRNPFIKFTRTILSVVVAVALSVTVSHAQGDRHVRFPDSRLGTARAVQLIEQQTGMTFSYNPDLLDVSGGVVFSAAELSLDDALEQMLADKGMGFLYRGKYIILHPEDPKPQVSEKPKPAPKSAPQVGLPSQSVPSFPERMPEPSPAPDPVDTSSFHSDYRAPGSYLASGKALPSMAVKTNLLYGLGTLTPNIAFELGLGQRTSIALSGSYNPWNRIGTIENNDKLVHFVIRPEFRYWFCERFYGHFVSAGPFYNQFNIGGKEIPFVGFKKQLRYEGNAIGFGVNYGYLLPVTGRLGVEFSAGAGVAFMKYDRFDCTLCSGVLDTKDKTYFGPTHFGISLVYTIR